MMVTVAHSIHCHCLNNCKLFQCINIFHIYKIFELCSINGKELNVGQKNLYDDPCQDWLDLTNKKLTSPNYPEVYDPNTYCKWNLTTEKGNYISLDFEFINVSDKDNAYKCLNDFQSFDFAIVISLE